MPLSLVLQCAYHLRVASVARRIEPHSTPQQQVKVTQEVNLGYILDKQMFVRLAYQKGSDAIHGRMRIPT
jgi:hypothetical protein